MMTGSSRQNRVVWSRIKRLSVALLWFATFAITAGCLWDRDTLLDERGRFPDVLEIITGKFPRHSNAFYEWRLQDRQKQLFDSPNDNALLDDVGVALDKLGRSHEAIEVALKQLDEDPMRYETLANLGTFYFHSGDFEQGLRFIDKAIEINPNAHFGRERSSGFGPIRSDTDAKRLSTASIEKTSEGRRRRKLC